MFFSVRVFDKCVRRPRALRYFGKLLRLVESLRLGIAQEPGVRPRPHRAAHAHVGSLEVHASMSVS